MKYVAYEGDDRLTDATSKSAAEAIRLSTPG